MAGSMIPRIEGSQTTHLQPQIFWHVVRVHMWRYVDTGHLLQLKVVSYCLLEKAIKGLLVILPRSLDIAQQFLQPMSLTHIHSPGLSEGDGLAGKQDGHRKHAGRHDVGFLGVPLLPA